MNLGNKKEYYERLSVNEYKKYKRSLEQAKKGFEEGDKEKVEFWLKLAKIELTQGAEYKSKSKRYRG